MERTVQDAQKQKQGASDTSGPTPDDSVDGMDTSGGEADAGGVGGGYNRRDEVMRASLVRCASVIMQRRRATLAVSDPAQQEAVREAVLRDMGMGSVEAVAGSGAPPPSTSGPDPLAAIFHPRRSSDGATSSAEATKRAVEAWESIPPQVNK